MFVFLTTMLALPLTLHAEYSHSYTNQDGDAVRVYGGKSHDINIYDSQTGADETIL